METTEKAPEKGFFQKKHIVRLLLVGVLIAVAAAAFAYGIHTLISASDGYRTVECTANAANCAGDFIFTYQLGVSGISPTAELKAVTNLYNEKAVYYYRLFHPTERFEGTVNLASLNASPNTELTLPPELYAALEKAAGDPGRNIYLAPFFACYDTLFASSFDEDAATWDPQRNADLMAEYQKTLTFVSTDAHVRVECLGGSKAVLRVSDEYLSWAEEVGIRSFVDFYWMKNAFIADALAADMTNAGYHFGVLSSKDGFVRNTDPGETEYAFDIFDERGGSLRALGKLIYRGSAAICSPHPFILDEHDGLFTYEYADGTRVTRYISVADALPHGPTGNVTVCSKERGCADLLLALLPGYLNDDPAAFSLPGAGILYSDGVKLHTALTADFTYTPNTPDAAE